MILLADEAEDVLDGCDPVAVVVVVGTRGLVVVVRVVGVVVGVTTTVDEVVVTPDLVLVDPLALLVRQLASVPVPTVKGAVWETAPVESRKVSPREVPAGSLAIHVMEVVFSCPNENKGLAPG
jgi:hypothetical protein